MGKATVIVIVLAFAAACGEAAPPPKAPDAVAGATELTPPKKPDEQPAPPDGAAAEPHVCRAPLTAPTEVWPRIEAIRALPAEERASQCDLDTAVLFSDWRPLPVDLLGPMVSAAAKNPASLDEWAASTVASAPKAVADIVAMDIAGRFAVGGDPEAGESTRERWASSPVAGAPEVAAVLEEAKKLSALFAEVNAVHELRCLLEVNPLGFAVTCAPIHPAQTPISLNWTSAVRDGVLEKLELSSCSGSKSCPKLKKGAEKLVKRYTALVAEVEKLKTPIYRERLLELLVLPPFTSRAAAE